MYLNLSIRKAHIHIPHLPPQPFETKVEFNYYTYAALFDQIRNKTNIR